MFYEMRRASCVLDRFLKDLREITQNDKKLKLIVTALEPRQNYRC